MGSPEKPLSDLGAVSYKSYWASVTLLALKQFMGESLSVIDISMMTSIMPEDVYATLQLLGLLYEIDGEYSIYSPPNVLDMLLEKYPLGPKIVDPDKLLWTPLYVIDPSKDKFSYYSVRSADYSENRRADDSQLLRDDSYFNVTDVEYSDD